MAVMEDVVRDVQLFRRLWICSFKEHRLEDSAVSVGLASCPGLDWLHEIVSVLGRRLKVHRSLRALSENQVKLKFNNGFLIGSWCFHCM